MALYCTYIYYIIQWVSLTLEHYIQYTRLMMIIKKKHWRGNHSIVFFTLPGLHQYFKQVTTVEVYKNTQKNKRRWKIKTLLGIWTRDIFPQTWQHLTFLKNVWIIYIISRCVVYTRFGQKLFSPVHLTIRIVFFFFPSHIRADFPHGWTKFMRYFSSSLARQRVLA